VVVVDDTFNANPASARASLDVLDGVARGTRRVVVTPGLIELGERQGPENEELAREIERRGAELVIVGSTNGAALLEGYGRQANRFRVRDDAVAWVRTSLHAGDAVLYLNDLPDHYP
jgi:UDP-N-acetylmuramoyl-tripeptide--D-alanyl-D-alanine ligase